MKKFLLTLAVVFVGTSAASAAPINNLGMGQTAVGFSSTDYYLEHGITDRFTLGYQRVDRDFHGDMNDFYGQYSLNRNVSAMVGSRNLPYDSANVYVGLAAHAPLAQNLTGYATFAGGKNFNETQVGANVALASNVDLNVHYHAFNPDRGRSQDKFGFGATLKF